MGCIAVHAQDVIELQSGGADDDFRANHRNVLPNAEYGNYDVYVLSWENIGNVALMVNDVDGNVIFRQTVNLLPATKDLNIHGQNVNKRYKIEMIYGSPSLYGFFAKSDGDGGTE